MDRAGRRGTILSGLRRSLAWAVFVVVLVVAGCVERGSASARGESDALVVAVQGDAMSLDPHLVTDAASMRMIEPMYSGLLRFVASSRAMATEPDLAERVEVSGDGLTWRLTLREGARFGSGRAVTAGDVVYSLERIRDQGIRGRHFERVVRIDTEGDRVVVLGLDEPFAPLGSYLAHPMNVVVDREVVEASGGDLSGVDAGCGPYRLERWRRGQSIAYRRHGGYHHAGLPRMERLVLRPIPDTTARTTALRTGEVDLLHEVPPKHLGLLSEAEGVVVSSVAGTFWEYIGLNVRSGALSDVRVRRAIAWATDRERMNEAIKFGTATVLTGGPIPPGHWAAVEGSVYPGRDVEAARRLLAESGYEEGLSLELIVDANVGDQVAAAEMLKQQLKEVGIGLRLQALEPTVFYSRLNRGDFEMTIVGWMGFVDPDQYLNDLFHSGGRYNQQGYGNAEVDGLIERGVVEVDREARAEIYRSAQRLIAREAPMVFLYMNPHTSAWRERVRGYHVHPTGSMIGLREADVAGMRGGE